jgi:O-antigen ligase
MRSHSTGNPRVNLAINFLVLVLGFCLPLMRVGVTIAASLLLVLWLFEGRNRRKLDALLGTGVIAATLLFVILNLLSLLWTDHTAEGLHYLAKYRYLLLIPVIATSLRRRFLEPALNAFLCGLAASLVWSYGIFVGLIHFGKRYPEQPTPSMLHMDYSMFLALAALLVLNRLVRRRLGVAHRVLWIAFLLFILGGLFINIGRSGQLAFFATLLVVLPGYLSGRPLWRLALACSAALALLVLTYTVAPVFQQRVDAAVDEVRAAIDGDTYETNQGKRIAGMIVARDIFCRHPLIGTGIGDNMVEFHSLLDGRYADLKPALVEYRHMHNQYTQVATELGLIGIAAVLLLFVELLRLRHPDREMRSLAVITASVFLFGCLAEPFLHKQLPLVLFSFMVGLVAARRASAWWHDGDEAAPAADAPAHGLSAAGRAELEAAGRQLLESELPPPGQRPIKSERRTVLWAQELAGGTPAVLKLYRRRGLVGAVRARLLRARVEREFRALELLRSHGVPCPEPLFWTLGHSARHGFWELMATREIPAAVSLAKLVPEGATVARRVDFRKLFGMAHQMHRAGLFHGALFASNILVGPEEEGSPLYLTDASRSILFPTSIVGTRMALFDLLDLCEILLRNFDCAEALDAYPMDPAFAARFHSRWPHYHPIKTRRQRLRGEFLLRRALHEPRDLDDGYENAPVDRVTR